MSQINMLPTLLVTANVGSIFEEPDIMLKVWIKEFLTTVEELQPRFIGLHCQEVGGKNYESNMKHVQDFVRSLMASEELSQFDRVRVYLDEDFSSVENFTALGSLYFIHQCVETAYIWDFVARHYVPVHGKEVHSGNIEDVPTKEKAKFPQEFYPECKWSRKGFLRTRWKFCGNQMDQVNIHLFHDASNFVAMENYPSVYSNNRRRALEHTIDRFLNDDYEKVPFFMFGDFNFRLDMQGVIKRLTEGLNPVQIPGSKNGESKKLQYRDGNSQVILSLGKKEFSHQDHEDIFLGRKSEWLRDFDKEIEIFGDQLFEFDIHFPPSYPFEEDLHGARCLMRTRCPGWCDRIIMSHSARQLVKQANDCPIQYSIMGQDVCMGDHKPIYLFFHFTEGAGMVWCVLPHNVQPTFDTQQPKSITQQPISLNQQPTSTDTKKTQKNRLRLISHLSESSLRLTAHHSSSDEDWFEEVDDLQDERNKIDIVAPLNNNSYDKPQKTEPSLEVTSRHSSRSDRDTGYSSRGSHFSHDQSFENESTLCKNTSQRNSVVSYKSDSEDRKTENVEVSILRDTLSSSHPMHAAESNADNLNCSCCSHGVHASVSSLDDIGCGCPSCDMHDVDLNCGCDSCGIS